jgi:hypothetical protein
MILDIKPTPLEIKPMLLEIKPMPLEIKPMPLEIKSMPLELKPMPFGNKPMPLVIKSRPKYTILDSPPPTEDYSQRNSAFVSVPVVKLPVEVKTTVENSKKKKSL